MAILMQYQFSSYKLRRVIQLISTPHFLGNFGPNRSRAFSAAKMNDAHATLNLNTFEHGLHNFRNSLQNRDPMADNFVSAIHLCRGLTRYTRTCATPQRRKLINTECRSPFFGVPQPMFQRKRTELPT